MNKKISIITLCYNQLENATKPFINSLYKYTNPDLFELIIVNNNSSDKTKEYLEQIKLKYDNIKVINNAQNLGYAKGNNQGLKAANGEYLFLLNNDVLLTPSWLENMITILDNNPEIGILSCMTNYCGNPKQLVPQKEKLTPQNYIDKYPQLLKKNKNIEFVEKVIFFTWAMKRNTFEKIGFLDEDFGLAWFEDDDYTVRVLSSGLKAGIAQNTFIYHNYSQTSKNLMDTEEGKNLVKKNQEYFQKKHFFFEKSKINSAKKLKYRRLFAISGYLNILMLLIIFLLLIK